MCAVRGSEKERVVCISRPEQHDVIRRWRDALEGKNKEMAFELLNQVLDGKIMNEVALSYLDSKHDR